MTAWPPNTRFMLRQDVKYQVIAVVSTIAHVLAGPLVVVACVEAGCFTTRMLMTAIRRVRR